MHQGIVFHDKSQNYQDLHKIAIVEDTFHIDIYFSGYCLDSKEKISTSFHNF
jgi:hypothetical protein